MHFREDFEESADDIYGTGWYEEWATQCTKPDQTYESLSGPSRLQYIAEWRWEEASYGDNDEEDYEEILEDDQDDDEDEDDDEWRGDEDDEDDDDDEDEDEDDWDDEDEDEDDWESF
jgi:hypothetical protein